MGDITNSMGMKLGTLWEMVKNRKAWFQRVRNDLATAHTHITLTLTLTHTHTHTHTPTAQIHVHTYTHTHTHVLAQWLRQ